MRTRTSGGVGGVWQGEPAAPTRSSREHICAFFSGAYSALMGLDHLGGAAVYLGAGFLIACSSRSVSSAQDASAAGDAGQPDGASRGEVGSRDASGADSAPSSDGSAAEASLASCPPLPIDAALPPDASCPSPDDTDHDGVPDCLDGCPYDPTKIAPGFCGCNTPDIDSDGDGVPDASTCAHKIRTTRRAASAGASGIRRCSLRGRRAPIRRALRPRRPAMPSASAAIAACAARARAVATSRRTKAAGTGFAA